MRLQSRQRNMGEERRFTGWREERLDIDIFRTMISEDIKWRENTEEQTRKLASHIIEACDAAMIRRLNCPKCKPIYGWGMEIAELKKKRVQARSKPQRQDHTAQWEVYRAIHKHGRRALKVAIKRIKTAGFKQVRHDANSNLWQEGHRLIMAKLKGGRM
uniref:Uncharacterized protein n=1 Tax=Glossina pallidipes TaxID=7398 RepID=A0A1B0ACK2_GLOPL